MHFCRDMIRFPPELDAALLAHFTERSQLGRALAELWPRLARGRGQAEATERHYSFDHAQASAYAAYYLPANALKLSLVLEEARLFGLSLEPAGERLRWLDVGSGPGTALWGLAWWARARGVAADFVGLEQSPEFLTIASRLGRALEASLGSGTTARWKEFRHGAKSGRGLPALVADEKPHVLGFMNSIAELSPDLEVRTAVLGECVTALAEAARASGKPRWLVLVEPGSKASSRELLELRERLRARPDVRVWLPCLSGTRACGALQSPHDWCHEDVAVKFPEWMNELGAAAGLRKESLLFSYLVCSVGVHPPEPPGWPREGLRVVSQLMKEKGLSQCFLCSERGRLRARLLNSRATESTAGFAQAVRGRVFRTVELGEKGDVLGYEECGAAAEPDPTVFPPLR